SAASISESFIRLLPPGSRSPEVVLRPESPQLCRRNIADSGTDTFVHETLYDIAHSGRPAAANELIIAPPPPMSEGSAAQTPTPAIAINICILPDLDFHLLDSRRFFLAGDFLDQPN